MPLCASGSKRFGVPNRDLTARWHVRCGGRGAMTCRHVERKALGIHSQLRSPSSSEVAGMIQGASRHCARAEMDASTWTRTRITALA